MPDKTQNLIVLKPADQRKLERLAREQTGGNKTELIRQLLTQAEVSLKGLRYVATVDGTNLYMERKDEKP